MTYNFIKEEDYPNDTFDRLLAALNIPPYGRLRQEVEFCPPVGWKFTKKFQSNDDGEIVRVWIEAWKESEEVEELKRLGRLV